MLADGIYDRGPDDTGGWLRISDKRGWYIRKNYRDIAEHRLSGWDQVNLYEPEKEKLTFLIPLEFFE